MRRRGQYLPAADHVYLVAAHGAVRQHVNGAGNGDLLHIAKSGKTDTLRTYLQPGTGRPHLITTVRNGLGSVTCTPRARCRRRAAACWGSRR